MIINHNIAAMNTYRQLTINNSNTSKSLEKLSSGLRINRAGDDAAGLAISEKMRAQIRGLDQASRNSQDAISLIQTAEGAMSETHSILQRMRELAVQASSDTNTEDDRKTIQQEINQLTSEVNRIGKTTEFNTKKLLNGDAENKFAITGTSFSGGASSQSILGGTGTLTTGSGALTTGTYKVTISKTTSGVAGASGGQFFDGSQKVVGTVADVGYANSGTKPTFSGSKIYNTSGLATSGFLQTGAASGDFAIWNSGGNVIVSGSNNSGVTLKDVVTADSSGHFSYNNGGVMFSITSISGWNSGSANRVSGHFSGGAAADLGTKQDYFTTVTGSGGKNAAAALGSGVTLDSISGGLKAGHYKIKIDFTNNSGKITVTGSGASGNFITDGISGIASGTTAAHYNAFGLDFKVDFTKFNSGSGSATLEFDVEDQTKWTTDVDTYKAVVTNSSGNAVASGTIGKSASYQSGSAAAGLSGAASVDIGGLHLAFSSGASPTVGSGTFNVNATDNGEKDDSLTFQIGANEHQSLNLSIGDVQSVALGISSTTAGSGFGSGRAVTDGTNADNIEYALDVTTTDSAAKAITTLDNAINKVSTERSKLGAVQNRLEHTINNLGTSSENLSAAESRIRDVDMAKTMMDFTKNNILTQAAQAMLAQANQQPQGVLQLLR